MRRGRTDTYPAFPEIEAQLGYNPARFLVPTDDEMDELSWTARATAFIRGMENVETVRAWIEVEVALEQGANGGPRKQVIKCLNHRQAALDGTDASWDEPESPNESSREDTTATTDEPVEPTSSRADVSAPTALAADGGTIDATPSCPVCHGELTREEIAGKTGYWCPQCQEFQEPVTTEAVPA